MGGWRGELNLQNSACILHLQHILRPGTFQVFNSSCGGWLFYWIGFWLGLNEIMCEIICKSYLTGLFLMLLLLFFIILANRKHIHTQVNIIFTSVSTPWTVTQERFYPELMTVHEKTCECHFFPFLYVCPLVLWLCHSFH